MTDAARGRNPPTQWRDPAQPNGIGRRASAVAVIAAVLVVVTVLGYRLDVFPVLLQSHPAPRLLPAPTKDKVLFVLYPDFPEPLADSIRNSISAEYGLPGSILLAAGPIDPAAWNRTRQQYGALQVVETMVRQAGPAWDERTVMIGLTTADLYIEDVDWDWAFASRNSSGVAVISMHRMHRAMELDGGAALIRKMIVRQLGFLAFRLPPTDDPGDLMYADVLSVRDLVHMADHL